MAEADFAGCHGAGQTVLEGPQRRSRETFDLIAGPYQARVGAVNCYARFFGGFERAMCCYLAFFKERAKLGHMEIKLGLLPGGCGTRCLPRVLRSIKTKEILMTGRMMPAAETVENGAALETGTPDALNSLVMEFAEALAEIAPVALREAKSVVDNGLVTALDAGLTLVHRVLDALSGTEDGKEGIVAFMEVRAPAFKGQ